jgi:hypothetical protein
MSDELIMEAKAQIHNANLIGGIETLQDIIDFADDINRLAEKAKKLMESKDEK